MASPLGFVISLGKLGFDSLQIYGIIVSDLGDKSYQLFRKAKWVMKIFSLIGSGCSISNLQLSSL